MQISEKAGLSVCIIAKNEEKMLADCLKSVQSCANEIILVDTGSNDNTIQIAKKFGCKVFEQPWENDFSKARNFSLEQATYPYILVIDADERLLNPEILKHEIESSNENVGGWLIEVKSEARRETGDVDIYFSNLLRLFKNHPNIRFTGIIHEQVLDSVTSKGLTLKNSQLKFVHLGYSHNLQEMNKKQLRNLKLLDIAVEKNPTNAYNLYQRAKTHLALHNLEDAEKDMLKSLQYVSSGSAVKPQALNFGAVIAYQRKDYELALKRAGESLELVPNQAFANYILGETYLAKNNYPDAIDAYQRMSDASKTADVVARIVGDYHLPPEILHFKLGKCYIGLKVYDAADIEFRKGLLINPNEVGCLIGLANVAFYAKQFDDTIAILKKAESIDLENKEIQSYLKQTYSAIEKNKESQKQNYENHQSQINTIKPLLSLCMIVKNEEENLAGCLDTVKNIADEIIIVDTGSTDSTIEIAKKYNAKIYHFEWINDFAVARNEALRHCTGEWILYLDADERLVEPSRQYIRPMLQNSTPELGGFVLTIESSHSRLDGDNEMHRGGYPRIFRNYGYPTIQFQGRVHEQIAPSIFALGKSIAFSDVIIQHLGYDQPREVMDKKIKRNYEMLMQHINEDPLSGYAWFQLGQTLGQMQLSTEAETAIRFSIQLGDLSNSVFASAAAALAQLVGNQKKFEETILWADKSLEKAPDQAYALHLKAYALLYLDKNQEAEQLFLKVLQILRKKKGVPQSGFDIVIPEEIVFKGLNEAREKMKKK